MKSHLFTYLTMNTQISISLFASSTCHAVAELLTGSEISREISPEMQRNKVCMIHTVNGYLSKNPICVCGLIIGNGKLG